MKESTELHQNPSGQLGNRLAFTPKETAELLGTSTVSIYRLIKRGKLRCSDALRHKLIPRAAIEAFLAE